MNNPDNKPKQAMDVFFARPDVQALQNLQKRCHPDTLLHKEVTEKIKALATAVGAGQYFKD